MSEARGRSEGTRRAIAVALVSVAVVAVAGVFSAGHAAGNGPYPYR
jgi:hypothetical protein